tara:strand:- start:32 stop:334 length:303 start_codon:yes stop_codon:yes gene_type:complete
MELIFDGSDTPISGSDIAKILGEINGVPVGLVQKKFLQVSGNYLVIMPGPQLYETTGDVVKIRGWAREWYTSWDEPIVIKNEFNKEVLLAFFAPDNDDGI